MLLEDLKIVSDTFIQNDEVVSMTYNAKLFNIEEAHYWTTTRYDATSAWIGGGVTGRMVPFPIDDTENKIARCVKR